MLFSFSFAKNTGALIEAKSDGYSLYVKEGIDPSGISEALRLSGSMGVSLTHPILFLGAPAFDEKLKQVYADAQDSTNALDGIDDDLESIAHEVSEVQDLLESKDDAPIIKLLNTLFSQAVRQGASDIHIEPFEGELRIRFRIDGELKVVLSPNPALSPMLSSRVKVMANLDIAEKRLPQDGRISVKIGGRPIDLRVSTIPGAFGERVVMRVLDKSSGLVTLENLSMPPLVLDSLKQAISKPHGIVLVTGPTGSGKTTTLYSCLDKLNKVNRNVMTIEDPIEYNIGGINQTQVNTKTGMTFAKGLRAILRQDPDVVMVGEIRDRETADIAVQSSLTGHLVFSTLHTNTASGAITRLRDMGVEPFLLASSLNGILAQRLIRKLCPACKTPRESEKHESDWLGVQQGSVIYDPCGCEACNNTGFKGRTAIYEFIEITKPLRALIHDGEKEQSIEEEARKSSDSLHSHGVSKVISGETSLTEVLRVTQG